MGTGLSLSLSLSHSRISLKQSDAAFHFLMNRVILLCNSSLNKIPRLCATYRQLMMDYRHLTVLINAVWLKSWN